MLSHLKFHRRGPANPGAAPGPNTEAAGPAGTPQDQPPSTSDIPISPSRTQSRDGYFTLPPIARVASRESQDQDRDYLPDHDLETEPTNLNRNAAGHDMAFQPDSRSVSQAQRSPYNNMDSGFIGGVALQKYKREQALQASKSRENTTSEESTPSSASPAPTQQEYTNQPQQPQQHPPSRQRPMPAPINTATAPTRPPPQALPHSYGYYKQANTSFIAPTDHYKNNNASSSSGQTGRRPAGTRLTSEPALASSSGYQPEPQKTKKSLPFLKNPMSLLARRKNAQNSPDLHPLPIQTEPEVPTYDPRIRGTKVHDFSAPRRREGSKGKEPMSAGSRSSLPDREERGPDVPPKNQESQVQTQYLGNRPSEVTLSTLSNHTQSTAAGTPSSVDPDDESARLSSSQQRRPVPQREVSASQHSIASSHYSDASTVAPTQGGTSVRAPRSRNISISSDMSLKSRLSGLPKHMKSTSSRFSFDMIGAAKQEKILEERHRQRQAEKQVEEDANPRDSRFDDFDDDFDYDAMMDDDGLEERIPGVNADYDEEDDFYVGEDDLNQDDPDNDQENFAGFSFQRSNGTSPLPTSHEASVAGTPHALDGDVGSPPQPMGDSLMPPPPDSHLGGAPQSPPDGLGIQGVEETSGSQQTQIAGERPSRDEDLYFDNSGLGGEFAEDLERPPSWDGAPFDESIFDNHDTDKYGRPIAGAFAQAQSERQAALQEALKRESDVTSGYSAPSETERSTAHTSVSNAAHLHKRHVSEDHTQGLELESSQPQGEQDQMAAYQAALAAAANKAAASGRFQWAQSPAGHGPAEQDDELSDRESLWQPDHDDHDDSFGYEDMNDFELEDDTIIAAANAEALAYDSDGWYGQEFGFYSAPTDSHRASSSSDADYLYANGGFFGPKDAISRTKSGRVVSREPNLTPITERSEYSNRNSVMSMALSGHGFGPGTPIQSPGLAQLAMMADRSDEMSLSALLRLRNKAWGGSQASLVSSKEGSPKSDRGDVPPSPWASNWNAAQGHGTGMHVRKGSLISGSYDSEAGSMSGMSMSAPGPESAYLPSPSANERLPASSQPEQMRTGHMSTEYSFPLTASISNPISASSNHPSASTNPLSASSDPAKYGGYDAISPSISRRSQEPVSPSLSRKSQDSSRRSLHQHRNSADSISYTREDETGAWVVERRRVDESGQVEMEREVVEGGRI